MKHVHTDNTDRGALAAFGLSSLTTDSVFASPSWEYIPEHLATPRRIVTTKAAPRKTVQQHCDALTAWADTLPAVTASADAIMVASADPMGMHRWSMNLEHAATAFLALHGETAPRPDVFDRYRRRHVARRDAVAGAAARYTPPQPCRYGRTGNHPGAIVTGGVIELLTALPRIGNTRKAWRGHRAIVIEMAPRTDGAGKRARKAAASAATQAARAAAGAGKRGKAVSPWEMSPRSLPAAVQSRGVAAAVAAAAGILATAAEGVPMALTDGTTVTVVGAAQVMHHDRAYPIQEWARRAAIAGVEIA